MANHPQGLKSNQKDGNKRYFATSENEVSRFQEISQGKKTSEALIKLFISEIEPRPCYYRQVTEICTHLRKIMTFFYKDLNVEIIPFGSSETKLALRESDVDIFLDFRGNLPEPPDDLLRTLKNKVRKYRYFISAIPIFARIPILQCVHRSGLSCDLSFINAIGVVHSHLVRFLLSLDDRLRPLILILKFLMKREGLIAPKAVTSYAIVILIMYFLQTIENPIIPPISLLQKLANKPEIIADWDMSFSTETSQFPKITNDLSVTELLQKFFEFYSTFEFGFYVISSFTAMSYLKPVFSETDMLPVEFQLYKKNLSKGEAFKFDCNRVMCVQGPFNHCNNITRNTTQKCLIQFQQFCENNAAKGKEIGVGNDSEEKKLKFLNQLLQENIKEPTNKKLKKCECVIIYVGQNLIFDNPKCSEDDLRNKWSEYVFNTIKDILIKVMKTDIKVDTKEQGSESSSYESREKIISCDLHYQELITKKRNEVKCEFQFPQNMPIINQEEIISNYLCDSILKDIKKVSIKFEISCSVKKGPTRFCMNLISKEEKKCGIHLVQQVFQFIENNFPKWINNAFECCS